MHRHIMEYYSSIKKKKILRFVTAWMDTEGNMLSEISQTLLTWTPTLALAMPTRLLAAYFLLSSIPGLAFPLSTPTQGDRKILKLTASLKEIP